MHRARVVFFVAGMILLFAGCTSAETKSVKVSESKKGDGFVVAVSEALAREVFESAIGTELDCNSDLDPDFEHMLRTLDREGRGSRASIRDGDTTVHALRKRKSIKFDVRDGDGKGSIEAVVPWAFAECLLGRSTAIGESVSPIKVKITGDGGGTFEFKID